jgi:1-phosphofructokinase family hexose kinase
MQVHTVTLNPVTDLIYLINSFEKGTTFRCGEFLQLPAGKGINVSYILSCYGVTSSAHAIVGNDEAQNYQSALENRSITARITTAPILTRKHCTLLEKSTRSVTHAQIHSQAISPDILNQFEDDLFSSCQRGDIAVFSGSLPKDTPTDTYAKWIKTCHENNILPVFDSSGDALREGVLSSPWMLKSNEHEAEELIGKPIESEEDIKRAAQYIQSEYNIPYVILSLGSRGLAALGNEIYYRLRMNIDPNRIIDSVGCGDAVAGGFLFAWMQKLTEEELFSYAITTATAAATVLGPGTIELNVVDELLECVDCQALSLNSSKFE